MARIPKELVNQIIHHADIVEVVGDFVSLKRKGQNMWACCPFHHEKSPSFSVAPAKGLYKCFGCGKAGGVVQFIMDIEGTSYVEALKYLAKKYGIEVQEEEKTPEQQLAQNEKDSQFIISSWAKDHYRKLLEHSDEGQSIGWSYLRQRGLNQTTIATFELGYSLDQWDDLLKSAEKAGYELKYLEKTGLVVRREDDNGQDTGRRYDRFRGRVMFPIHNVSGRVIGFGARTLKANDKTAKYLNSPESDIYHKSDVLYGLYQGRQAIRTEELCYLVEGYLDVLSLHQGGIKNVVASSGTSLTEGQIRLIKRYTDNVTVLYDGDAAGIRASLRGIDMLLEGGLNVRVVLFPDGDDPDSYIRKVGDQRFKDYLEQASQDFIQFKTDLVSREAAQDPVKRAEAIREVLQSIVKVPDPIKRQVFLQQTSKIFGIDEQEIFNAYRKLNAEYIKANGKNVSNSITGSLPDEAFNQEEVDEIELELLQIDDKQMSYEKEIVRLLFLFGSRLINDGFYVKDMIFNELDMSSFKTDLALKIIEICNNYTDDLQDGNYQNLISHPNQEVRSFIVSIVVEQHVISNGWSERHEIIVHKDDSLLYEACENAILRLNKCNVEREMIKCMNKLKANMDAIDKSNVDDYIETMTLFRELKMIDMQISARLGTVIGN